MRYTNPILSGFYPDPSICRVDDDFYLVTSTFAYFPGIPVFHSRDLVNWKCIGHVIDRIEQMDFEGLGVSKGIFAPTIRYHSGIFYVTCTLVDGGGNFVVTTTDPAGPWSLPHWLPINGIDPSLFFDDDGSAWMVFNSTAPDNKPLYDGHRTIRMIAFDTQQMQVFGEEIILVNGGTDLSKQPRWIEGPHIYKKEGYYYLIAAEGGTGYDHSVVAFRCRSMDEPFLSCGGNPVLSQRTLDHSRKHPVTSTGHADLVELPNGNWYAVFLACRPYEGDYYNTGRETFLVPLHWEDNWPVLNHGYEDVKHHYPLPLPEKKAAGPQSYSGNFLYRDDFNKPQLDMDWMFLRTPKEKWYHLDGMKSGLTLDLRPETCSGMGNPSFLARRQQHLECEASVSLEFSAQYENEKAGLIVFQNEDHFYFICVSLFNGAPVVELHQSILIPQHAALTKLLKRETLAASFHDSIALRIRAMKDRYAFDFSTGTGLWVTLKEDADARLLSTRVAGGFVGCVFALYATSSGKHSGNAAHFDWFAYKGEDEMYKGD